MSTSITRAPRRLAGVEGLRAVAAGSVLVFHGWKYGTGEEPVAIGPISTLLLPNLALGVTLFFTLSAFLLYRPFAAALVRDGNMPSVRRYLHNRALRILPAYWVVLIVIAVVFDGALVRTSATEVHTGSLAARPSTLLADLLLLQNYSPATVLTGIGPAWSLAVEVVFYLMLPLLAYSAVPLARRAGSRRGRRRAALLPAVLVLLIGSVGKVAAYAVSGPIPAWDGDWHSVIDRSFLSQADLFTFGLIVAVLRIDHEDDVLRLPAWWRKAAVVTGLLAVALAGGVLTAVPSALSYYVYQLVAALACALLLALVVLRQDSDGSRLERLLERRPVVAVGVGSYGLFLWHEPVIRWLEARGLTFGGLTGVVANVLLLFAISACLAALTYRFVEAPALRLKHGGQHRTGRSPTAAETQAAP